mmetsp:Transcript_56062/g.179900  ORF Transcript_56062/g.179900 Transcript_56062/m.179900 type:complete len:245 (+) Transcript_56062:577-1311(+)
MGQVASSALLSNCHSSICSGSGFVGPSAWGWHALPGLRHRATVTASTVSCSDGHSSTCSCSGSMDHMASSALSCNGQELSSHSGSGPAGQLALGTCLHSQKRSCNDSGPPALSPSLMMEFRRRSSSIRLWRSSLFDSFSCWFFSSVSPSAARCWSFEISRAFFSSFRISRSKGERGTGTCGSGAGASTDVASSANETALRRVERGFGAPETVSGSAGSTASAGSAGSTVSTVPSSASASASASA